MVVETKCLEQKRGETPMTSTIETRLPTNEFWKALHPLSLNKKG